MNPRTLRILHSLAVLVWSAVLLYFYGSGRINQYLAPDFRPLVLAGGLGLAVLGAFNLLTAGHRDDGGCHDDGCCGGTHDHGSGEMHPLVVLVLMIAPVLLSVAWTKDRYSPAALARKGLYDAPRPGTAPAPSSLAADQIEATHRRTADGFLRFDLMELYFATGVRELQGRLDGMRVETEGRWMSGTGERRLYRMFITCCAADSRAIPIRLEFSGSAPEFHDNTWVRVSGTMRYRLENGTVQPVMEVARAEAASIPDEEHFMMKSP